MGHLWRQWLGAIVFYTTLPLPRSWAIELAGIARWCPWVGLGLGLLLAAINWGLAGLGFTDHLRAVAVVGAWVWFTGGLHLDGAMDTADGLAVLDPSQRLVVMADSRTGAFGVMAAILILGLKVTALAVLAAPGFWALGLVMAWGRWGQVWAIACYPYLKAEGKGAFHKTTCQFPQDFGPGILVLLLVMAYPLTQTLTVWPALLCLFGLGLLVSFGLGAWLDQKLGGHTGDTYGAIVEWTEAILLGCLTLPYFQF
ncbi:adenosylcobinamide-GDP ribazoletransferase [Thermosynechococcaceae cyanobacterium BACA0444]|uniref:Adenosylcobinamide-GDP ribazoletransferase n=1 Tax=Pseudocalidococcus azoricus BACA0444 TaxID=2918990 RepID=A0AAE4FVH1_9CYAN|nr:adenosylcobinamide-GDP ribazoletransferase [Pseudocalidococcus azoricus]MDS3862059.1 adenosylcobinamide-GDP ribazoletransferase [Pseudocalidococcus azoricus BACA0444]